MMNIPASPALILMVAPVGAGKSTFARKHFGAHEIVSSDDLRQYMLGDFRRIDNDVLVWKEVERHITDRLMLGQRAVLDATSVNKRDRKKYAQIGFDLGVPVYYIVIDRPVDHIWTTAGWRREIPGLVDKFYNRYENTKSDLKDFDGFRNKNLTIIQYDVIKNEFYDYRSAQVFAEDQFIVKKFGPHKDVPANSPVLVINQQAFPRNSKDALDYVSEYDKVRVIADVHSNVDALKAALDTKDTFFMFLGDLIDYGSFPVETVDIVYDLIERRHAMMVRGNHENKIFRWITQERGDGFRGKLSHGNTVTVNQIKAHPDREAFENKFIRLYNSSPDWVQIGDHLFVHGAALPDMFENEQFRAQKKSLIETYAQYGETDGTTNADGFPTRTYGWTKKVPANRTVIVGHDIRSREAPVFVTNEQGGRTIFLDTGSSKDGHLSWADLVPDTKRGILRFDQIGAFYE